MTRVLLSTKHVDEFHTRYDKPYYMIHAMGLPLVCWMLYFLQDVTIVADEEFARRYPTIPNIMLEVLHTHKPSMRACIDYTPTGDEVLLDRVVCDPPYMLHSLEDIARLVHNIPVREAVNMNPVVPAKSVNVAYDENTDVRDIQKMVQLGFQVAVFCTIPQAVRCTKALDGVPVSRIVIDNESHPNAQLSGSVMQNDGIQFDVAPRSFNELQRYDIKVIRKTSSCTKSIKGEIHWYTHIPADTKDMFPLLYEYDSASLPTWYVIEEVHGSVLAKLLESCNLSQCENMFTATLNSLRRIHRSQGTPPATLNIDRWFVQKLDDRYRLLLSKQVCNTDVNDMYRHVRHIVERFAPEWCSYTTPIHGDPVTTNVIINAFGKVKFIDMRGCIGDTCTIYGPTLYDYAKVLQSISGYDDIVTSYTLSEDKRDALLRVFQQHMDRTHPGVSMRSMWGLVAYLVFTLMPLHDVANIPKFADLYTRILKKMI